MSNDVIMPDFSDIEASLLELFKKKKSNAATVYKALLYNLIMSGVGAPVVVKVSEVYNDTVNETIIFDGVVTEEFKAKFLNIVYNNFEAVAELDERKIFNGNY